MVAGPGFPATQEAKAGERLCFQKRRDDKVGTAAWILLSLFTGEMRNSALAKVTIEGVAPTSEFFVGLPGSGEFGLRGAGRA